MSMNMRLFVALGDRFAKLVALVFCTSLIVPAFAQVGSFSLLPAAAASSSMPPLPEGVKVLARVPLQGTPITRMFTQREYGHTFLYIEHGQQRLTTVDVTKKRNPRIVEHQPGKVEPVRYEALSEGDEMEIWPQYVISRLDVPDRGTSI